jgi:hypothetical protein
MYWNERYINMETYTFWYHTKAGYEHEETGLTKRQAVIRSNRINPVDYPSVVAFGWELEREPIDLNSLMEEYA